MQLRLVLLGIVSAYSLHRYCDLIIFVNCDFVALNCGSGANSTALDGREWVGESAWAHISGKSRSATTTSSNHGAPYKTSRISTTGFRYTFHLSPGQKFLRLHFYPASYRGFENSVDYFSVKAGPFTLLRDYSASLSADTLSVKSIVKEFCLNVKENLKLNIVFSPSRISGLNREVYAFVNGIEIISMPTGLYYTPENAQGAQIVGLSNGFYVIDNTTALEMMHRLNVGGSSVASSEDFGLFRCWTDDTNYMLERRATRVNHLALQIKYTNMPAFVAPPKIFQASWKSGKTIALKGKNKMFLFRWKVPVDSGFGYLIRLHFCELEGTGKEFSVLINNQIAEAKADVMRWSGGPGIPIYRDYAILLKGGDSDIESESSKSDILIGLEGADELVFDLLKGLEIFKMSDLRNNLAAPNPVFPKSKLKTRILYPVFNMTNMTVALVLLSVVMHKLREFWEENYHDGNDADEPGTTEPSFHYFSLAEIKSATQNFSRECIIGKGGFGNVYKGKIRRVAREVAIKRSNPNSSQGAREFSSEIETLSKLRHINLVSLLGYCDEGKEMILVYDYMPRGTIADNLYKKVDCTPLTWEQRLSICTGAARGLEYLHTGGEYGVIHRDVKDTNILLDENLVAKIADFGLSKPENISPCKSHISTNVKGTVGYWDPHYVMTHKLTRKSDVYSFGVVMLVILSGRRAMDNRINPGEEGLKNLVSCFWECVAEGGNFSSIIDPCLQREISRNGLIQFLKIVEKCLHGVPEKRPTMTQVVSDLERALGLNGCPDNTRVISQSVEHGLQLQQENKNEDRQVEESVTVSPPDTEETTTKTTTTSRVRERDLLEYYLRSGRDQSQHHSAPVRKTLWSWPKWKLFRNKGTRQVSNSWVDFESSTSEYDDLYQEIIYETVASPLDYAKKKELFNQISHSADLINDGKLSFWLSKSSGKKCYMLCARELSITWIDNPVYWVWRSIAQSRFSEVAELRSVCWLYIGGKIQANMLSFDTTYAAYLVFKVTKYSYGLKGAAKAYVGLAGQESQSRPVHLIGGRSRQNRKDGWLEICLGEFFNDRGEVDIEMKLRETETLNWKKGLILEGIEVRPKEDA